MKTYTHKSILVKDTPAENIMLIKNTTDRTISQERKLHHSATNVSINLKGIFITFLPSNVFKNIREVFLRVGRVMREYCRSAIKRCFTNGKYLFNFRPPTFKEFVSEGSPFKKVSRLSVL